MYGLRATDCWGVLHKLVVVIRKSRRINRSFSNPKAVSIYIYNIHPESSRSVRAMSLVVRVCCQHGRSLERCDGSHWQPGNGLMQQQVHDASVAQGLRIHLFLTMCISDSRLSEAAVN